MCRLKITYSVESDYSQPFLDRLISQDKICLWSHISNVIKQAWAPASLEMKDFLGTVGREKLSQGWGGQGAASLLLGKLRPAVQ